MDDYSTNDPVPEPVSFDAQEAANAAVQVADAALPRKPCERDLVQRLAVGAGGGGAGDAARGRLDSTGVERRPVS